MGGLTDDGKRLVAEYAFVKGKNFIGSAILLRKHGGLESVALHLICQGVEITLKALLLLRNYDKYRPQLKKPFGHDLIKLSGAAVAEFGVRALSRDAADELGVLNKLYSNHWLRYGGIYDLLVDPRTIPSVRTLRKLTAVIRLTERIQAARACTQPDAAARPTSPVQSQLHPPDDAAMAESVIFADVLDAAEQLEPADQAELVAVLTRRLAERGRERVAASVEEARREFAAGGCQPTTAAELMREAQS